MPINSKESLKNIICPLEAKANLHFKEQTGFESKALIHNPLAPGD